MHTAAFERICTCLKELIDLPVSILIKFQRILCEVVAHQHLNPKVKSGFKVRGKMRKPFVKLCDLRSFLNIFLNLSIESNTHVIIHACGHLTH